MEVKDNGHPPASWRYQREVWARYGDGPYFDTELREREIQRAEEEKGP